MISAYPIPGGGSLPRRSRATRPRHLAGRPRAPVGDLGSQADAADADRCAVVLPYRADRNSDFLRMRIAASGYGIGRMEFVAGYQPLLVVFAAIYAVRVPS
jgi:hypothetical protein